MSSMEMDWDYSYSPEARTGLAAVVLVIVVVVERSEMFTYDGNDLQVSLVRAFSHDELFHDAVRSVGSEQRLLITRQQQASVTGQVIQ